MASTTFSKPLDGEVKNLSDQIGKNEFDCGTETIPANVGTGTLDIGVTFNRTFTHAPKVVATFNETPPFSTFDNGYVGVTNISTTGCHLRLAALQNSSYTWNINWIAVNVES